MSVITQSSRPCASATIPFRHLLVVYGAWPDLAHFLTALRPLAHGLPLGASIAWLTTYDRNAACGHPTNAAGLRQLEASGWRPCGPG